MHRFVLSLFAFSAILLLGAGCTLKFGSGGEGGVFKSLDGGTHWVPKHTILTSENKKRNMGNAQITSFKIDPRNANRLFAGTLADGLFVSENGAESWTSYLPKEYIIDVALDSSSRCVVYVLTTKQLNKTTDCGGNWTIVYDETRPQTALTSVESDAIVPEIVYVTTSDGDVLKSTDRGTAWTAVYRLPNVAISDLVIDRWDSNLIYIATARDGVFRSGNKGVSWEDVSGVFKDEWFSDPQFRWVGTLSQKGGILFVDQKGMYRSRSSGNTWERISLLTPEGEATILGVAVNPHNDDEIMYATPTTFYHTTDGGAHWLSRPLPSERAGAIMAIDPYNTENVYLGTQIYRDDSPFF